VIDLTSVTLQVQEPVKKGPRNVLFSFLKKLIQKIKDYITKTDNLKTPMFWIAGYIFLRGITVFCREYGLTLFKKNLKGEHVFLTGAGGGIGRLMAIRLGEMGCKLSLSDINAAAI